MTVDHSRAVRDLEYFGRKQIKLAVARARSGFREIHVVHDHNGACYRREPWKVTFVKLIAPIVASARDREMANVQALTAEHEPTLVIADERSGMQ